MIEPTVLAFLPAAVALAIERLSYIAIWRNPAAFEALCRSGPLRLLGEPVQAVQRLFYSFKAIQAIVFFCWIALHGEWFTSSDPTFFSADLRAAVIGAVLIVLGQTLNFAVFFRLGRTGVFYGCRFGHDVPWVHGFPFSVFSHPQYLGTAISIWGLFLLTRFPHPDWIVLPLLETVYYCLGAHFERDSPNRDESNRLDLTDPDAPSVAAASETPSSVDQSGRG